MIQKVFSVRDLKAEAYLQPFFSINVATASRAFSDECNKAGSGFNAHSDDYMLFELADFDDVSGQFFPLKAPKALGIGSEFINK